MTITANDQNVSYGTAVSTVIGNGSYTASGFVNSETASVISGVATYTTTYTSTTPVGTGGVTITPMVTGLTATNYSFTPATGIITITGANSTIMVTGATSYVYSGKAQGPTTATVTGSTGAVTYSYSGVSPTIYGPSTTAPTNVGTYQVIASVAADANYLGATSNAYAFTISKAVLTITANSQSVAYGTPVSTVTGNGSYTASGFVNGETASVISGTATYTTTYTATTLAGTSGVTITPIVTNLTATNYSFTPANGTITITGVASTIMVTGATSYVYNGKAQGPATATVTGSTGAVTYSYSGVSPTVYGPSTTAPTNVGTYQVVASVAADANYLGATSSAYAFTISKAVLTITANNQNVSYGTAVSTVTGSESYIPSGFVNGETASVISGTVTYTTTYTATTPIGSTATITPVVTALKAANYSFVPATGIITVTGLASTITVTGSTTYTYNGYAQGPSTSKVTGSKGAVTYSYSGTGTTVYGPSSIKPTNAGTYQVIASVAASGNYSGAVSAPYAFVINQASAIIVIKAYDVTYDGKAHTATGTAIGVRGETLSGLNLSGTTHTTAGTYTDTWAFVDPSGNYKSVTGTISDEIDPVLLTITADNQTHQYSDPNPTLTYTITGFVNGETSLTSDVKGAPVIATAVTSTSAPQAYSITVQKGTLTSTNYTFKFVNGTFTVTPEDARTQYTGTLYASTNSSTVSNTTVTLKATVSDITAVNGDPAYDQYAGDIKNAKVMFVNRDASNTPISGWLDVSYLNASDTKVGTVTYNWSVDIGSSDSKQFTVGIVVGNYYVRNASVYNTIVTVSKSLNSFATGGGYVQLANSGGSHNGDNGSLNNFGFSVRKTNTSTQGTVNTIIRRTESDGLHVYQITGSSMTSLSITPATTSTPATASFVGTANVQDITNVAQPVSVISNNKATIQMTMTDNGEPGTYDRVGITVKDASSNLWFSSNWQITNTTEKQIGGGDVQVLSSSSVATGTLIPSVALTASPTPSLKNQTVTFSVTVTGSGKTPTGLVSLKDNTTGALLATMTLASGKATFSTATLLVGVHEITAYYGGDKNYDNGAAVVIQTVSSSTLVASPDVQLDESIVTKVFPNPFSYKLNFNIQSPVDTHVLLEMYDITGRKLVIVCDQEIKGSELYTFEYVPAGNVAPGMLIYRLTVGERVYTGKAIYQPR